jgi:ribosomal protein S18 acetylase RimI-like enzyme
MAEEARRSLGWICVGKSRDDDATPTTAEVWAMYIDPSSWRRGIGRALWGTARSWLEASGITEITLWVLRDNQRACDFYLSLGFREESGRAKRQSRGGVERVEIRLRRVLHA